MFADQRRTCQDAWRQQGTNLQESNQINYRILVHPGPRVSESHYFADSRSEYLVNIQHHNNNSF